MPTFYVQSPPHTLTTTPLLPSLCGCSHCFFFGWYHCHDSSCRVIVVRIFYFNPKLTLLKEDSVRKCHLMFVNRLLLLVITIIELLCLCPHHSAASHFAPLTLPLPPHVDFCVGEGRGGGRGRGGGVREEEGEGAGTSAQVI